MSRIASTLGRLLLGVGMIGVGAMSLVYQDFNLAWQPVPDWAPMRTVLACASGLMLVGIGASLSLDRGARLAAIMLATFIGSWILLLHVPRILSGRNGAWVAPAECLAVASGAWVFACSRTLMASQWFGAIARRMAQLCFAATLLAFGISHFIWIKLTAAMIPAWIPWHAPFAYFAGAAHIAAGLSLGSNILSRLAAPLLAIMFCGFVLLVHIPGVIARPDVRHEWQMLWDAVALAGAAWIIAGSLLERSKGQSPAH